MDTAVYGFAGVDGVDVGGPGELGLGATGFAGVATPETVGADGLITEQVAEAVILAGHQSVTPDTSEEAEEPIGEFEPEFAEVYESRTGNEVAEIADGLPELLMTPPWVLEEGSMSPAGPEMEVEDAPFVPETIIGPDNRKQVMDTSQYPFSAICALKMHLPGGTGVGTGWLAGPRLLMTCGHNLKLNKYGGVATKVEIFPRRNGNSIPIKLEVGRSRFRLVRRWLDNEDPNFDYAAIILPEDIGSQLGYFGFNAYDSPTLQNMRVNVTGYPGARCAPNGKNFTQWWHGRTASGATGSLQTAGQVNYTVDTTGGQSGSPAYTIIQRNGKRYRVCVGIHTYGVRTRNCAVSSGENSATRITQPVMANILNWRTQS